MLSDSKNNFGFLVDEFPDLEDIVKSPCSRQYYSMSGAPVYLCSFRNVNDSENCFGFAVDEFYSLGRTEKSHVRISVRLTGKIPNGLNARQLEIVSEFRRYN